MKNKISSCLLFWLVGWSFHIRHASAQDVCLPCADGSEPFALGKFCENGIELAETLTTDMEECRVLHLALFQNDCCDSPPEFCTLCENGSQNYNLEKIVPNNAGDPPIERTCEDYATLDQFLKEGTPGTCRDTERARASAWCECDGIQPECNLTCNDGNPPPDLAKTDPVFGKTCERFVFEYMTLSSEECLDASLFLEFDSKAFCCNEPAPENCSICSAGKKVSGDNVVQTEFFGSATCGEIEAYATYLFPGTCSLFLSELLDDPFDAESKCCVEDSNEASGGNENFMDKVVGVHIVSAAIFLTAYY